MSQVVGASAGLTTGLTGAEVRQRERDGRVNSRDLSTSRSLGTILRGNLLTRFNAVLGALFVVVLLTGELLDALFGAVLVANTVLGTVQEWRAKRTLDRLQLLRSPHSTVRRDGTDILVPTQRIVQDDLVVVRAGDEIPVDGTIIESDNLHVNEASLTGEAVDVARNAGDTVMSGTHATAGTGILLAVTVGAASYAQRLTLEARRFSASTSQIQRDINRLLHIAVWALVLLAPLHWWNQFRVHGAADWREATGRTVAGLVGLVPEGLVLLTTLTFLTAAVQLARHSVLVQQLPAIETLARVDTLCLDKTGTLTTGAMRCTGLTFVDAPGNDPARRREATTALGMLADDPAANETLRAIGHAYPARTGIEPGIIAGIPFDSTRKWKAVQVGHQDSWYLGAPERLVPGDSMVLPLVEEFAARGQRVLLVAHSPRALGEPGHLDHLRPVALVHLEEEIRDDAADTVAYFARQGVELHVLSGDHPATARAIAMRLGIDPTHVHGRVTPEEKHRFVQRLQSAGKVVAMTGDGVNDVLAVKTADIGIAMDNAAPATTSVAELVLLDGCFAHLVAVIDEGRRVIGNVERVANLFVIKNVMSAFAILAVMVWGRSFPFLPRQMTLVSTLGVGVPAFVFAIGTGAGRQAPGFLRRLLCFTVPSGAAIGAALVAGQLVSGDTTGTTATITALLAFLWVNVSLSRPWTGPRAVVLAVLASSAAAIFVVPAWAEAFNLAPTPGSFAIGAVAAAGAGAIIWSTSSSIRTAPRGHR